MKSLALLLLLASGCVGATHAGPFVTNISSDGRGGVIVEKCMAKYDPNVGAVTNDQCTTTTLRLDQASADSQARR